MTDKETVWTEDEINAIKEHIVAALEQVIDPELGIDIVNLGLVYEVELYNGGQCVIKMTLTTMGCPLADVITEHIIQALKEVPEVSETKVDIV